jgi:hypothetical protein
MFVVSCIPLLYEGGSMKNDDLIAVINLECAEKIGEEGGHSIGIEGVLNAIEFRGGGGGD